MKSPLHPFSLWLKNVRTVAKTVAEKIPLTVSGRRDVLTTKSMPSDEVDFKSKKGKHFNVNMD